MPMVCSMATIFVGIETFTKPLSKVAYRLQLFVINDARFECAYSSKLQSRASLQIFLKPFMYTHASLLDEASVLQDCRVDGLRLRMLSTAASTQSSKSAWSISPRMQRLTGIVSTTNTKESNEAFLFNLRRTRTGGARFVPPGDAALPAADRGRARPDHLVWSGDGVNDC